MQRAEAGGEEARDVGEGVGGELRAAKRLPEVKIGWGGGEGLQGPLRRWRSQGPCGAGVRTASPGVRKDEAGATTEGETSRAASSIDFRRRSSSCFFRRAVIWRSSRANSALRVWRARSWVDAMVDGLRE